MTIFLCSLATSTDLFLAFIFDLSVSQGHFFLHSKYIILLLYCSSCQGMSFPSKQTNFSLMCLSLIWQNCCLHILLRLQPNIFKPLMLLYIHVVPMNKPTITEFVLIFFSVFFYFCLFECYFNDTPLPNNF